MIFNFLFKLTVILKNVFNVDGFRVIYLLSGLLEFLDCLVCLFVMLLLYFLANSATGARYSQLWIRLIETRLVHIIDVGD